MVRQIPRGKVTSYGQIAKLIGHPQHSRMVGSALRALGRDAEVDGGVPWHRVVASNGTISKREASSMRRQAQLLQEEGVVVGAESRGLLEHGGRIDLTVYGWSPTEH